MSSTLRDVPFQVTNPERLPSQRYYDSAFYQAELEHLWPRVWQMACRLEQIPNVGDWVEYENLGRSVLIVRTREGIRAYHNACRHRGAKLSGGSATGGNCAKSGFVCPFHGWRWNMDGENVFVYGRHLFSDEQLDPADLALRKCRVETWAGCAFINLDDEAPSLRESLGAITDRLEARGASNVRAEAWYAIRLPANWKVAMEAFMEGYHTMATHPQLQHSLPFLYNNLYGHETGGLGLSIKPDQTTRENIREQHDHLSLVRTGMGGMLHEREVEIAGDLLEVDLPDNPYEGVPLWYGMVQDQITARMRAEGYGIPDLNAVAVSHPVNPIEYLFPNFFLLPFFNGMSSYRIRPLGPEECLFELWSLMPFKEGNEPEPLLEPQVVAYDSRDVPPIPRQDYSNIPNQQQGLHTKGFEFMRLSREKEGLISNYQRIIDAYLAGQPWHKLTAASSQLGGNFDGNLLDFGF